MKYQPPDIFIHIKPAQFDTSLRLRLLAYTQIDQGIRLLERLQGGRHLQ